MREFFIFSHCTEVKEISLRVLNIKYSSVNEFFNGVRLKMENKQKVFKLTRNYQEQNDENTITISSIKVAFDA